MMRPTGRRRVRRRALERASSTTLVHPGAYFRRQWPLPTVISRRHNGGRRHTALSRFLGLSRPIRCDLAEVWSVPLPFPTLFKALFTSSLIFIFILPFLYFAIFFFGSFMLLHVLLCPLVKHECVLPFTHAWMALNRPFTAQEERRLPGEIQQLLEDVFLLLGSLFSAIDIVRMRESDFEDF
ncbi:uncharacterized protein LOC124153299 [Ischnura elegans]|uniref:uncharacterized protein LOC124153299 n=1 Tax=Ischnura elegans TaxID=197161 RepID=UPI001ED8AE0D|nr:uncharacterized protein LOC124153299 [Ischnura elegans]